MQRYVAIKMKKQNYVSRVDTSCLGGDKSKRDCCIKLFNLGLSSFQIKDVDWSLGLSRLCLTLQNKTHSASWLRSVS